MEKTSTFLGSIVSAFAVIGTIVKTGCYPVMARSCNKRMGNGNKRFNHIENSLSVIENLLLVIATPEQISRAKRNETLFREKQNS